jgi:hypothetical protein
MILTIANISSTIAMPDFERVVAAIGKQVSQHFQPEWGKAATLKTVALTVGPRAAPIDKNSGAIIYVGDDSQDPTTGVENALGYHGRNHARVPYGFVYLDICAQYGDPWSSTLSHEVLELLEDPTAIKVVTGPAPDDPQVPVYYDLEVCDPTQGDSYEIDGVVVSNFVGRAYFGQRGGSGKTNYLDLQLEPFGVRPKGYFQFEDGQNVYQVNGEKITQSAIEARREMGKARRNARRAARIQRDFNVSVGVTTGSAGTSVGVTGGVHFDRIPPRGGPVVVRAGRVQRDVGVSVTGTTGTSGSSVSGTITIHLDRAPLAAASGLLPLARQQDAGAVVDGTNGATEGSVSGPLTISLG